MFSVLTKRKDFSLKIRKVRKRRSVEAKEGVKLRAHTCKPINDFSGSF